MTGEIKRIAVNTGGGDAPGLNAVIRAVVLSAVKRGWEVVGIRKGYEGLLDPEQTVRLDQNSVRGITHIGGTILGTTNKGNPFEYPVRGVDGSIEIQDLSDKVVENFNKMELDALVAIGGDGSLRIAHDLHLKGVPVVGVPKTIDNDLESTVFTFGFDTAVTVATEALDRLHSTAEAHERVMVVEVMGRYAGWIALNSGVSSTCDVILIPEIPYDIEKICEKINDRYENGRPFAIVVAAEGAKPVGGGLTTTGGEVETGRQEVHLGGIADRVAAEIKARTGHDTRSLVLGHIQRGGTPTPFDRLIALRFGAAAVRILAERVTGVMVALDPPEVKAVPLIEAISRMKSVPIDCDTVQTAMDLGVSFGQQQG